jgi:hypothetical protein
MAADQELTRPAPYRLSYLTTRPASTGNVMPVM